MEGQVAYKVVVDKEPNRLFLRYLTEWRDEAKQRGDKSKYTYGQAIKSLKKYSLPLQCGEEAKILENFGDKICKMLDSRLERDADASGVSVAEFLAKSRKVPDSWWKHVNQEPVPVNAKKPAKRKKPQKNTEVKRSKDNNEVIIFDKASCSPSETLSILPNENSNHDSASSTISTDDSFSLFPGQFEIILCVDARETMGENRRREIKKELEHQNVNYDQRTLNLGDFLWVAREKSEFCGSRKPKELVLDYVVERKVPADLSMSIRDGRFREQKIRLKNSGINNIIYLIENISKIGNQSIPEQTLRQAIYNTEIIDKISVKYTKSAKSTVIFLDIMTKQLQKLYSSRVLATLEDTDSQDFSESGTCKLPTFEKFNKTGAKQRKLTVNELFLRQLMQIHGMSYDKASSVTKIYETPSVLVQKYRSLETDAEKEALLSKIKFGLSQRNLGIALSRVVYSLFS